MVKRSSNIFTHLLEFVDAASKKTFKVVNPATEETICEVAEGDKAVRRKIPSYNKDQIRMWMLQSRQHARHSNHGEM